MRRRNKRGRGAHESHDRWLITYADLITLLMIFFVILYAMSQIDVKKYDTLAQSLNMQFRKSDGVLDKGTGITGGADGAKYGTSNPKDQARRREQALQDLLRIVEQYVKENHLQKEVFVADTPKGIAVRFSDRFLFDLGRADLKPGARPVLDRMSSLFDKVNTTISIQGHTDNLAVQPGAAFQDNWGLSAGRALSVLRYFVDVKGLREDQFEVAGYADTRPIAKNDSEANRQKNRRVEILVLRQETDKTVK